MNSTILRGDCMTALDAVPRESIHAVVTDPPYHLTSIVKRFGAPDAAPCKVGKTGAYARASKGFMGKTWDGGDIAFRPETWARIGETMKPGAHLAAFGGTRTFHRMAVAIEDAGFELRDTLCWLYGSGFPKSHNQDGEWKGWGTALKPAWEPIILARKPLVGTVAANLAAHRTGAINVDGCRVVADDGVSRARPPRTPNHILGGGKGTNITASPHNAAGRWPANVAHDGSDEVLAAFPDAKGQQGALTGKEPSPTFSGKIFGKMSRLASSSCEPRGDSGSAARFFYCAKTSRSDRNDGTQNNHPTVKPTDLMRWLCRLITPPGGTVLDPFMGSGSTGRGAALEGFSFIGCELDAGYADIAEARIAACLLPTIESLLG